MSCLFLGDNRQYMLVCAKRISSYVRKVLSMAKVYVYGYSLGCYGICSCGSWCLPDLHPAWQALGQSFYSRCTFFSTYVSTTYWQQDSVQHLSWTSQSFQFIAKCQILTYIKSCRYVELLDHNSPQYLAHSSSIVSVALMIDSWHYCSGEQGLTVQHLLSVCLK